MSTVNSHCRAVGPDAAPSPGARIVVVGVTGSGKTTLARQLAQRLQRPHVELDALHWEPDWQPAPLPVFRARVAQALAGETWVVDGNYSKVRDLVWPRAETLIWLDYSLPLVLWRLARRSFGRVARQELLWSNNRETWRQLLFSRDSIFLWALKTHPPRRREIPQLLALPQHVHLQAIRLRSPAAAQRWLARVGR